MYDFDSWKIALISLGSNVGDKELYIGTAVQEIACIDGVEILASSSLMSTEPVGVSDQEEYLNQILLINTIIGPAQLLRMFKDIEKKIGRIARGYWGPREIDIDIATYEGVVLQEPGLIVPHPQFFNRNFMMMGAMELFPDYVVDGTNKTIAEIYNEIKDTISSQKVKKISS
jgi:dihydroneopterin aldolase / 2-amino-4-hydroxy-6-hydroxymethyldihydropteridine diphosphokinase